MAELKTVSLRLPVDLAFYVTGEDGINRGIIKSLESLILLKNISLQELKGIFTPDEWKFLADSLNGTIVSDAFRVSKSALVAHIQDAELYDRSASKWSVDVKAMSEKVSKLSGAHIDAIYGRIEKYWDNSDTDIDKWSEY